MGAASEVATQVRPRRQQILDTAARLFAERGFHGVSVADLGAACGMSGPALYKHFGSKDDVLAAMLVEVSEQLLSDGRDRVAAGPGAPVEAVRRLVAGHVEFALRNPAVIVVQDRDWPSLPVQARARVRELQLAYVEVWAEQLRQAVPDLDAAHARARVHAAFGLINSTPHSRRLPEEPMADLLRRMAEAALLTR